MFIELIEKNKKNAFEYFVEVRKQQDKNTIVVEGNIYSFITKRGNVKKYIGYDSYRAYRKSEFYPQKAEQVNSFWFVEIKE